MKRILWAILWIAVSTNLPAPLFPYYQAQFGLSNLAITTLFAIYAACLLPVLLISSALAKRYGLRLVSQGGLLLALLSALTFLLADAPWILYAARVLEGLAVGAFMGTSNALLLQYSTKTISKSLQYSSMCNMFGFGFGPLLCGLLLQYVALLPHQLSYLLLAAALLSALFLSFTLKQTPENLDKDLKLLISLGVPHESKALFWTFIAPAAFTMLALNGIVISLIPTYVKELFHSSNMAFSGLLLFLMLSGSGIAQSTCFPKTRMRRIQVGIVFLILGTWSMVLAAPAQSAFLLTLGMLFQAIGTGWTFQGTLQAAGEMSTPETRSSTISTFFVCAYSGMAFPTIGIGLLSTLCGLMTALSIFAVLITVAGITICFVPLLRKNAIAQQMQPATANEEREAI